MLNTKRITIKQTTQSKPSVSHNVQLGTTYVNTNPVIYTGSDGELIKKPVSTPIKLTKLITDEICTIRGEYQNHNISSFPPTAMVRESDFWSGKAMRK